MYSWKSVGVLRKEVHRELKSFHLLPRIAHACLGGAWILIETGMHRQLTLKMFCTTAVLKHFYEA